MDKEDMGMIDVELFIWIGVCFAALSLILLVRFIKGPTAADRAMVGDTIDTMIDMALICFSLFTGRAIYLDIAMVTAVVGFVGTIIVAKCLGGDL